MALIPINQPRQQYQPQQQQVSGLDKDLQRIMQGLQIANAGFGIAVNYQSLQDAAARRQAEQAQQQQSQQLFPLQLQKAQQEAEQAKLATEGMRATTPSFEVGQKALELKNQMAEEQLKALQAPKAPKGAEELRKEWLNNPITKNTQQAQISIEKIASAAEGQPTAAKQHSLIFNYMKMVDPGSTVREGEFATVEQAGSAIDRYTLGLFNKTLQGEFLTPKQQEDFINTAKTLFNAQMQNQQRFDQAFTGLAERQGISPQDVVLDLGFKQQKLAGQDQMQQAGQQAAAQPQTPAAPATQFSDAEIQAVMNQLKITRAEAIMRLRAAMGGGQ